MFRIVEKCFTALPPAGLSGAVLAALDQQVMLAWAGAAVAAVGVLAQSTLYWYHQAREARREENAKDHAAELEVIRVFGTVQLELERRITKAEHDLVELAERIDSVRCVFPNPDGSPRCKGAEHPPCVK
jgi:hypothetical protein